MYNSGNVLDAIELDTKVVTLYYVHFTTVEGEERRQSVRGNDPIHMALKEV